MKSKKLFMVALLGFILQTTMLKAQSDLVTQFVKIPLIDAEIFNVDAMHSEIGFTIKWMGFSDVRGRFTDYGCTIFYNEDDMSKSSCLVKLETSSINTGLEWRDKDLVGENWFDAERYPQITFISDKVEKKGDEYVMAGTLTMHGVSKEIEITLQQLHPKTTEDPWGNCRVGFKGTAKLNRKDFSIVGDKAMNRALDIGGLLVGNEVIIELIIQGQRFNYEKFALGGEKTIASLMKRTISEQGVDKALEQFHDLKKNEPGNYDFSESNLVNLGNLLLQRKQIKDAIRIFKLCLEAEPESWAALTGLGEAYMTNGDKNLAIQTYKKALVVNPGSLTVKEILRRLGRT